MKNGLVSEILKKCWPKTTRSEIFSDFFILIRLNFSMPRQGGGVIHVSWVFFGFAS